MPPNKRSHNQYYHVYILASHEKGMVKVGKSNNLSRTKKLARMGYAGATDWFHVASFPAPSSPGAIALEAMVNSRLTDQGHKIERFSWWHLIQDKPKFADECFRCDAEHAISVALRMSEFYYTCVADSEG